MGAGQNSQLGKVANPLRKIFNFQIGLLGPELRSHHSISYAHYEDELDNPFVHRNCNLLRRISAAAQDDARFILRSQRPSLELSAIRVCAEGLTVRVDHLWDMRPSDQV